MKTLFLQDLKDLKTQTAIKKHIVDSYTEYGDSSKKEKLDLKKLLKAYNIIIAYESVGSWGCDSSSFFLIQDKLTGKYYEVHGGHCSCYGFEGQFTPEKESPVEYLKSDNFYFSTGGYDDNGDVNIRLVKQFISQL